jgi:hypothetical protein
MSVLAVQKTAFILFLISFHILAQAESALFICLKDNNLSCLKTELELDQKWQNQRDSQNRSPIMRAINLKNIEAINFFLTKGVKVRSIHVTYALKKFLGSKKRIFHQENMINQPVPAILERIILGAVKQNDAFISDVSEVLNLFGDRLVIAKALRDLFDSGQISLRSLRFFLREYKKLFLKDGPLSNHEIEKIIEVFLPKDSHHFLLKFILESFRQKQVDRFRLRKISSIDSTKDLKKIMAFSIMEETRQNFSELHPSVFIRHAMVAKQAVLEKVIVDNENLIRFISKDIENAMSFKIKMRNYKFWLNVFDTVKRYGDFHSAFTIGTALSQSQIEKLIGKRFYKEIDLLKMDYNLKNYRDLLGLYCEKFHIPSYMVIIKDLVAFSEGGMFECRNNSEILKQSSIVFLKRICEELKSAIKSAQQVNFLVPIVSQPFSRMSIKSDSEILGSKKNSHKIASKHFMYNLRNRWRK